MGLLSTWLSRLASPHSSKSFFHRARELSHRFRGPRFSGALPSSGKERLLSWSRSIVPFAIVASAGGALALELSSTSSLDHRIEGKEQTGLLVQGPHKELPEEFIKELKAILQDNMTLEYDERHFHGNPQNSFHRAVNIPDVIVYPRWHDDVQKIVISCNKYKVPITPYGGATSVEGQTLAPQGGLCIDMSLMKKIKSLHVEDMDVVVEPGVGWIELNEYLKPYGLFFPLDPGPGATIGGMCATRCSGSLAVRYGTMRDNVINLQVVLGNGDVIKTGSRARKSAAGYDLTRLIIGSEGTLGVITEVTLRLQKLPQHSMVAMCNIQTIKDAANAAIATMHSGIQIRKEALWACLAMAPNFEALTTDVCVPLSRLAECISKSKQELNASPLLCMVIAHAGDGNFHACILFDPDQEEQQQEAERLNHFIVHTALSMEGWSSPCFFMELERGCCSLGMVDVQFHPFPFPDICCLDTWDITLFRRSRGTCSGEHGCWYWQNEVP
ncbi:D-lactate dehydrogenase [cytochrome], mitochondrial isoform X10 [Phoenix dactylifera]|uniref:D-lactate dehydrogenase (cytochrome) n=1 Tax=Phoenix dactylifera TaxID=42345 RepID=A0A8B8ZDW7_PHODC|nr:D-lactate dehydrogenase [cytochrome], mitochondrial isoform X10 [Phoenix dactylifera]